MPHKKRKKVYVLCTGGTISMQRTAQGYAPVAGYLAQTMNQMPELQHSEMPQYTLEEYSNPIDSANMTPVHWAQMAEHIQKHYADYDGFVILHGTDTMAYTASALSFMLENLAKPVILTGSQLPLYEMRNDARENLINAILLAGQYVIPEVCVYFNNKLFRGNRCKKIDASSFAAFASPNFPALAKIGTDITIRSSLCCDQPSGSFRVQVLSHAAIGSFRLFPGMSVDVLRNLLQTPLQGLVLESYGMGTAPEEKLFLQVIEEATSQGILIVNCSQCPTAKVKMPAYATGSALLRAGVVSGGDMTVEAALAKMIYLFSQKSALPEIKSMMVRNLRGELSD